MALVRGANTKPELLVRRLITKMGYRYRLHDRRLPGTPDLVFARRHCLVFVHGCFWHRHGRCPLTRTPKSRKAFWVPKLAENKARDRRNIRKLRQMDWRVLVVWECQLKNLNSVEQALKRFLEAGYE